MLNNVLVKTFAIFVISVLSLSTSAQSDKNSGFLEEGGINSIIATADRFKITYNDGVKDGCLPSPSRLKDKMELSLRQNGLSIDEESPWVVNINAFGGNTGYACIVVMRADFYFWLPVQVPFADSVEGGPNTYAPISLIVNVPPAINRTPV